MKITQIISSRLKPFVNLWLVVIMVAFFALPMRVASAATLTDMTATLSTITKNVVANQTILFTTSTGLAAGEILTLTYESDFSVPVALNYEDIDLSIDAAGGDDICDTGDTEKTLAAVPSGATFGAVRTSSTVITITSDTGTIAVGDQVCVEIGTNAEEGVAGTEKITNATTAGDFTLSIAGTMVDSGTLVIGIVDDDSVSVSATVSPSLTFSISDVQIGFGALTSANARFATGNAVGADGPTSVAAHTMAVTTNATSGYTVTYNGATLDAGTPDITVATITGDEDGTPAGEQFAIGFTTNGNATITAAYNQVTPTFNYKFVAATETAIITEIVPTAVETFSAFYLANISGTTESGSYTTSITYLATANF